MPPPPIEAEPERLALEEGYENRIVPFPLGRHPVLEVLHPMQWQPAQARRQWVSLVVFWNPESAVKRYRDPVIQNETVAVKGPWHTITSAPNLKGQVRGWLWVLYSGISALYGLGPKRDILRPLLRHEPGLDSREGDRSSAVAMRA
jgi:hypothetical protein